VKFTTTRISEHHFSAKGTSSRQIQIRKRSSIYMKNWVKAVLTNCEECSLSQSGMSVVSACCLPAIVWESSHYSMASETTAWSSAPKSSVFKLPAQLISVLSLPLLLTCSRFSTYQVRKQSTKIYARSTPALTCVLIGKDITSSPTGTSKMNRWSSRVKENIPK